MKVLNAKLIKNGQVFYQASTKSNCYPHAGVSAIDATALLGQTENHLSAIIVDC